MTTLHVLITGAASGLGLGCARRFAALGAAVSLCDINASAGEAAVAGLRAERPQARLRFEAVDLADPASIGALAGRLQQLGEPIEVLINNAGIYPPANLTLTAEGQELSFAIAHLGHFRLTQALWPLLRQAESARVVSVSSMVQRRARLNPDDLIFAGGYLPILAYQQAKLSCLLFALELQRRLDAAGITAIRSYAAHPGVARTQLGRNRKQNNNAANAWQRFAAWVLANGLARFGQTPEQAAESVLAAATSPDYPGGSYLGPTGWLEIAGAPGPSRLGQAAADPALGQALWQKTEEITGIRWPF